MSVDNLDAPSRFAQEIVKADPYVANVRAGFHGIRYLMIRTEAVTEIFLRKGVAQT
eukprot:COSAG01_NODE_7065_length_3369_cov_10.052905_1_plen_56_part_00